MRTSSRPSRVAQRQSSPMPARCARPDRDSLSTSSCMTRSSRESPSGPGACAWATSFDPESQMGPVISDEHRTTVMGYIESGVADGATLMAGDEPGFFVQPTVLSDARPDMRAPPQPR
ncbi:aldehyde dehydrogenase family protein [Rhodococcus sp. WAY2]|uniref:aldehyde dehydrogenase family protein n=1 Tax=Rhodococcus sp. WAY2 TaxID=2663121 RepID=UPI003FA70DFF